MECRYESHTVFNIQYHFVSVTKYRYQVLKREVGLEPTFVAVNVLTT